MDYVLRTKGLSKKYAVLCYLSDAVSYVSCHLCGIYFLYDKKQLC